MISLQNILLVMTGSALGGALRFVLSHLIQSRSSSFFPWGTFVVNVVGCFLMGLVVAWVTKSTKEAEGLRLILATGFCGGFTTFSAFAAENVQLLKDGHPLYFFVYILVAVVTGILALAMGISLIK